MPTAAVVGGGSLGMLLAGRLAASGCDTELWTRTSEQAARINSEGLTVESETGQAVIRAEVKAVPINEAAFFKNGPILLALKQTALTPDFLERFARIVPDDATVALFQNGIGHVEKLQLALPGRNLVVAITTEAAQRIDSVTVRHTGRGETRLGNVTEDSGGHDQDLEDLLKQAGFSVSLSKQVREAMLRKLLINAVINPLTAILRVKNGELTQSPERLHLMKALFLETYEILTPHGLGDEAELWNHVLQVCDATKANRSSMLQDVSLHKETEIESINGQICRLASEQGKPAPWNTAVTTLVKAVD
ncbi:hypothetical protein SD71_18565 [Cohnella kolymensis]|uniref:2-dehydropantoate 2-reductase n=1 Tax=Cohnella kolymensis TaxID=1590652 RepID=A0ABR5A0S5_9BACL|nr:2-dehydropantoate 2-reductase [Cohnella kolymensis]KIL34636.1 hypothetical protein SD71_18565 [Cohnella kolymensis]